MRFFTAFVLFLSLILAPSVNAASLQIEPMSVTVRSGETFNISVNMGLLNGQKVLSTDVYLEYDPTLFEVAKNGNDYQITHGELFKTQGHTITNNRIYLYGIEDKNSATPISGKIATITLKALREGQGQLNLSCEKSLATSSKIIDSNLSNMIDCPTTLASHVNVKIIEPGAVMGASTENTKKTQYKPRPLVQATVLVSLIALAVLAFSSR